MRREVGDWVVRMRKNPKHSCGNWRVSRPTKQLVTLMRVCLCTRLNVNIDKKAPTEFTQGQKTERKRVYDTVKKMTETVE